MNERIDHVTEAANHRSAEWALVHATLALAEQERTRNLIAMFTIAESDAEDFTTAGFSYPSALGEIVESIGIRGAATTKPGKRTWRDAECGESWYLEPFGIVYGCVGDRGHSSGLWFTRANVFGAVENIQIDDSRITSGQRVWPVE